MPAYCAAPFHSEYTHNAFPRLTKSNTKTVIINNVVCKYCSKCQPQHYIRKRKQIDDDNINNNDNNNNNNIIIIIITMIVFMGQQQKCVKQLFV